MIITQIRVRVAHIIINMTLSIVHIEHLIMGVREIILSIAIPIMAASHIIMGIASRIRNLREQIMKATEQIMNTQQQILTMTANNEFFRCLALHIGVDFMTLYKKLATVSDQSGIVYQLTVNSYHCFAESNRQM